MDPTLDFLECQSGKSRLHLDEQLRSLIVDANADACGPVGARILILWPIKLE